MWSSPKSAPLTSNMTVTIFFDGDAKKVEKNMIKTTIKKPLAPFLGSLVDRVNYIAHSTIYGHKVVYIFFTDFPGSQSKM